MWPYQDSSCHHIQKKVLHSFKANFETSLMGLFQCQGVLQHDPRINSKRTSNKTNHSSSIHSKAFVAINTTTSALVYPTLTCHSSCERPPPHHNMLLQQSTAAEIWQEFGVQPLSGFAQYLTPPQHSKISPFLQTLEQWKMTFQYLRPQSFRDGMTDYTLLSVIFIWNRKPRTQQPTSVYIEMKNKINQKLKRKARKKDQPV